MGNSLTRTFQWFRGLTEEKIKLFTFGLIPGSQATAEWFGCDVFCSLDSSNPEVYKCLDSISRTNEHATQFMKAYNPWLQERHKCIKEIRELADNIDWHHRNVNIAQIPTSVAGIGGGILTLVGLGLIPVTGGASTVCAIAGSVIGGAAGVTGITTTATDIGITFHRSRKAQKCAENHQPRTKEIVQLANSLMESSGKVVKQATPDVLHAIEATFLLNGGKATKVAALGCKKAIETIPKVAKLLDSYETIATSASAGKLIIDLGAKAATTTVGAVDSMSAGKTVACTTAAVAMATGGAID